MDSKTYSDFNEEQLYLLEFFIDHIDLNIDTTKRIGKLPISVRLKFIDFPIFEINQEEFIHTKQKVEATTKTKEDKLKSGSVDFNMGKLCLFPKKPNDLVQAMRSQPLKVGIFTMTDKNECDQYKEEPAICETNVLLSGCLCDQVNMAINDKNHLPKPYILKNTYNLVDDQGNPSGTILLLLRLTCYGKSVVTQFALQDKFFLFKNSQSPNEFQCIKISSELKMDRAEICESISQQKVEDRLLKPQNVIGLVSICQELAKRDGGPLEINFPPPETVQRKEVKELFRKNSEIIDEEDPFFICPEDGNYLKTLSKIQSCAGIGCKGGLCVGTSLLDPLPRNYHGASPRTSCYTGSCCTGEVKDCCNLFRLRGGGCCEDNTPDSIQSGKQLKGIIDNPISMKFAPWQDLPSNQSVETLISGACKSAWKDTATPDRIGCGCFGKRGVGLDSGGTCSKKPCMGIDCLIKAFKETQEFVDSIGKVPGLAGLGLMDPSESPYFGREKENGNTYVPKSKTVTNSTRVFQTKTVQPLKKASKHKSTHILEAPSNSVIKTMPLVSKHTSTNFKNENLVRGKPKRKEDKTQKVIQEVSRSKQSILEIKTGPCGEQKCKSRKKTNAEGSEGSVSTIQISKLKKRGSFLKQSSRGVGPSFKVNSKTNVGKKRKQQNTGKDLHRDTDQGINRAPSKSFVKVSKRILKHVSLLRKYNPGIVFGHRNCLDLRLRVPKNMGWLWNTREVLGMKPQLGWKPGAISKYVYELLQEAKSSPRHQVVHSKPSTPSQGMKGRATRIRSFFSLAKLHGLYKNNEDQEIELPPTLHIHRKEGIYYITMYPIKQENLEHPEIQELVKPLQFKVTKNKDDNSICSSSTASELEIEFSPPVAINRYCKKPELKDISTQVKQQDILDNFKPSSTKVVKGEKEKTKK